MSMELDKNRSTVLAVAVAAIVQVAVTNGPFSCWNVMTGAILIFILTTYDLAATVKWGELAALACVWGLTITITLGLGLQWLRPDLERTVYGEIRPRYYFHIWLVITALAFALVVWKSGKLKGAKARRKKS